MTLYTEKEAGEKWCPLDKGSYSDRHIGGAQPFCIASRCMAWQAVKRLRRSSETSNEMVAVGYCGAFGKVEP